MRGTLDGQNTSHTLYSQEKSLVVKIKQYCHRGGISIVYFLFGRQNETYSNNVILIDIVLRKKILNPLRLQKRILYIIRYKIRI